MENAANATAAGEELLEEPQIEEAEVVETTQTKTKNKRNNTQYTIPKTWDKK